MDYLDTTHFERQVARVHELARLQPSTLRELPAATRETIERYFLGAAQADDARTYRAELIQADSTIELSAQRAYNQFLAAAGVGETITDTTGNFDDDLRKAA